MLDFYILNVKEKLLLFLGKGKSFESVHYYVPEIYENGELKRVSESRFWEAVNKFKNDAGEGNWVIGETEELFELYIGEGGYREIGGDRDDDIGFREYLKEVEKGL